MDLHIFCFSEAPRLMRQGNRGERKNDRERAGVHGLPTYSICPCASADTAGSIAGRFAIFRSRTLSYRHDYSYIDEEDRILARWYDAYIPISMNSLDEQVTLSFLRTIVPYQANLQFHPQRPLD